MGAEIHLGTEIRRIEVDGDRIAGGDTSKGRMTADAYVMALGNQAARLAAGIGVSLPVYPIKGYSLTIPGRCGSMAMASRSAICWACPTGRGFLICLIRP